jgi:spore coat polysaccharide biosynthesis protein SpsF (cytidylyltransferase family)
LTDRAAAHVVAIVQARMTSTRLPGKVLMEIGGKPCALFLLDRLRRAGEVNEIVVATSLDPTDDAVADAVEQAGCQVVRGPLDDVLERYRLAAEQTNADAIVRITSDCPLIDPVVVDMCVARWRGGSEDFVANCLEPRTYPKGLDTEVMTRAALDASAAEATSQVEREHVTPFVRAHPERFPHYGFDLDPAQGDVRVTLDTPEDLEVIRAVVDRAGPEAGIDQVIAAFRAATR